MGSDVRIWHLVVRLGDGQLDEVRTWRNACEGWVNKRDEEDDTGPPAIRLCGRTTLWSHPTLRSGFALGPSVYATASNDTIQQYPNKLPHTIVDESSGCPMLQYWGKALRSPYRWNPGDPLRMQVLKHVTNTPMLRSLPVLLCGCCFQSEKVYILTGLIYVYLHKYCGRWALGRHWHWRHHRPYTKSSEQADETEKSWWLALKFPTPLIPHKCSPDLVWAIVYRIQGHPR